VQVRLVPEYRAFFIGCPLKQPFLFKVTSSNGRLTGGGATGQLGFAESRLKFAAAADILFCRRFGVERSATVGVGGAAGQSSGVARSHPARQRSAAPQANVEHHFHVFVTFD